MKGPLFISNASNNVDVGSLGLFYTKRNKSERERERNTSRGASIGLYFVIVQLRAGTELDRLLPCRWIVCLAGYSK